MGLDKNTIPQVLYAVPEPESDPPSELYTINATVLDNATDPVKRWVLKEVHGYWDEQTKKFLNQATTILPNDPKHAVSIDDAYKQVAAQVIVRVREGFKYQREWNPMEPPHYFDKFEIDENGKRTKY